jgi:hypothetical protein
MSAGWIVVSASSGGRLPGQLIMTHASLRNRGSASKRLDRPGPPALPWVGDPKWDRRIGWAECAPQIEAGRRGESDGSVRQDGSDRRGGRLRSFFSGSTQGLEGAVAIFWEGARF